jgi:hypothetical protein
MLGSEYKWLLAPVRRVAADRAQLARRSFATLAVAAFCVACVLVPRATSLPSAATVAAPVVTQLDQAQAEWPLVLVRLWFLLPQLLPGRN